MECVADKSKNGAQMKTGACRYLLPVAGRSDEDGGGSSLHAS